MLYFDKTILESAILSYSNAEDKYIISSLKYPTPNKVINEPDPQSIHPEILKSWIRSEKYGLDPDKHGLGKALETSVFEKTYQENEYIIKAALPFIEHLSNTLFNSNYIFFLTDDQGAILYVLPGNDMMAERAKQINMRPGIMCSEETVGTTAHTLCLKLKIPIQTAGAEHYCNIMKERICSSAPIFDWNKKLLGTVNISTLISEERSLYTLGLVRAIAVFIENQIGGNILFRSVFETKEKACLIVNYNGLIKAINGEAEKRLNLSSDEVVGLRYQDALGDQPVIEAVLEKGTDVQNTKIRIPALNRGLSISIKPIEFNNNCSKKYGCLIFLNSDHDFDKPNHEIIYSDLVTFDNIIGASPSIRKSIKIAEAFSNNDVNILLIGESGVGKDVFAHAIHNNSRKGKPFVAINCAAIPDSLIESELFGYESGAFTGAERRGRAGKIELANEGTLFLDEIGDMPLELQPVLLRVIEEKKIMRLGSNRSISVNFRLIAATNKNLKEMIAQGKFREDLYYRLSTLKVSIPPLRERREDIIALGKYFVKKNAKRLGVPVPSISDAAKILLLNYSWPGNVRQLESVLLYAVTLCKNGIIMPVDLPDEITESTVPANEKTVKKSDNHIFDTRENEKLSIRDMEKIIISQTLIEFNNNVREAAKKLNISKSTLYRKVKEYNLLNI